MPIPLIVAAGGGAWGAYKLLHETDDREPKGFYGDYVERNVFSTGATAVLVVAAGAAAFGIYLLARRKR